MGKRRRNKSGEENGQRDRMKLFPTKKQFKDWSLPSKASIIGIPLAILFFVISQVTTLCSDEVKKTDLDKTQTTIIDTVSSMLEGLRSTEFKYKRYLDSKYDLGYCLIGFESNNITIPHNSRITSDIEVDWGGVRIVNKTTKQIKVYIAKIVNKPVNSVATDNYFIITRSAGSSNYMILYDIKATVEFLGENINGIICVLGFQTDELLE